MLQGFAKHGEYVDFGESWLVYLKPKGSNKITVDGRELFLSHVPSKEVFIKPKSVIRETIRGPKTLSHYEHIKTKDILAKKEYEDVLYGEYYDVWGEYNGSLEEEFEHRKKIQDFKENYQPVYHIKPDITQDLPLTCLGSATPTGSPYISTALAYGKVRFRDSGFYRVDWSAATEGVLKDFIEEHDLYREFYNPPHSNIRFAKIKGEFIFNEDIKGAKKDSYGVYSSLSEAKTHLEKHIKNLKRLLHVKAFGHDIVIEKATIGKVVKDLEGIQNCLKTLEVKQKSSSNKNNLNNKIDDLLSDYRKLVD